MGIQSLKVKIIIVPILLLSGCADNTPTETETNDSPEPTTLELSNEDVTLDKWGDTFKLNAVVLDQDGNEMSVSSVNWSSDDTDILSVDNGELESWIPGTTEVTASYEELSATTEVEVAFQQNSSCTEVPEPAHDAQVLPPNTWTVANGPDALSLNPNGVIPLDVDDDGNTDILSFGRSVELIDESPGAEVLDSVVVYKNEGNGQFTDITSKIFPNGAHPFRGPRDYVYLDLNTDSRLDVAVANQGLHPSGAGGLNCGINIDCPGQPNVLLVAQPGNYVKDKSSELFDPYITKDSHNIDAADIDCDGDRDLFESHSGSTSLKLNDSGKLVETSGKLTVESLMGQLFCDLDSDGDPDFIASIPSQRLSVFVNDGFGNFRNLGQEILPPSRGEPEQFSASDLACTDFDRDGLNDIIFMDHGSEHFGKWQLIKNEGDMSFSDWSEIIPDSEGLKGLPILGGPSMVFDLNLDGWPDLFTPFEGGFEVYWNTGGVFTKGSLPATATSFGGSAAKGVADLDGNGKMDIWIEKGENRASLILFGN